MSKSLAEYMDPIRTKDGRFRVSCICGWRGVRKVYECECYDYCCTPEGGGAGCPRGFAPCHRCGQRHLTRVRPKPPPHDHEWGPSQDVPGVGLVQFCKADYCPDPLKNVETSHMVSG